MSKERIQYINASLIIRLIAMIIDIIVVAIIATGMYIGGLMDWELLVKKVMPWLQLDNPLWIIIWFVIVYPIYFTLSSALTNGQTLGKLILGIRVMTNDNQSTKKEYKLHLKRFFFVRGGTKVVKEHDPGVKGL